MSSPSSSETSENATLERFDIPSQPRSNAMLSDITGTYGQARTRAPARETLEYPAMLPRHAVASRVAPKGGVPRGDPDPRTVAAGPLRRSPRVLIHPASSMRATAQQPSTSKVNATAPVRAPYGAVPSTTTMSKVAAPARSAMASW